MAGKQLATRAITKPSPTKTIPTSGKVTGKSYVKPPAASPKAAIATRPAVNPTNPNPTASPNMTQQQGKALTTTENAVAQAQALAQIAKAAMAVRSQQQASQSGSSGPSGFSGGGTAQPNTTPIIAAPPPVPQINRPAPTAAPMATPQVTAQASGQNVAGNSFTSTGNGGGTFGQFQRQRQNRGPQNSGSVTPEMLRRIAAERIRRQ